LPSLNPSAATLALKTICSEDEITVECLSRRESVYILNPTPSGEEFSENILYIQNFVFYRPYNLTRISLKNIFLEKTDFDSGCYSMCTVVLPWS
jgi:hypothetical protein